MRSEARQLAESDGEIPAPRNQLQPSPRTAAQRSVAEHSSSKAVDHRSLLNYVDTKWSDSVR